MHNKVVKFTPAAKAWPTRDSLRVAPAVHYLNKIGNKIGTDLFL